MEEGNDDNEDGLELINPAVSRLNKLTRTERNKQVRNISCILCYIIVIKKIRLKLNHLKYTAEKHLELSETLTKEEILIQITILEENYFKFSQLINDGKFDASDTV